MVDAHDPAFLVDAEEHGSATVRASLIDESHLSVRVPEGDKVLAEDLHADRLPIVLRKFCDEKEGMPIPAKGLSHWSSWPRVTDKVVFSLWQH
jgi:hypothetical protein